MVAGINLVTLLWRDGVGAIPCDYRLSDKPVDGVTKNEHFRAMLQTASDRGVQPRSVAFDSWSSSLGAYEDRPRQRLALADAPE